MRMCLLLPSIAIYKSLVLPADDQIIHQLQQPSIPTASVKMKYSLVALAIIGSALAFPIQDEGEHPTALSTHSTTHPAVCTSTKVVTVTETKKATDPQSTHVVTVTETKKASDPQSTHVVTVTETKKATDPQSTHVVTVTETEKAASTSKASSSTHKASSTSHASSSTHKASSTTHPVTSSHSTSHASSSTHKASSTTHPVTSHSTTHASSSTHKASSTTHHPSSTSAKPTPSSDEDCDVEHKGDNGEHKGWCKKAQHSGTYKNGKSD
ncbi:hypothetical protein NUU61_006820 [Penicillium alfredii]|uniref:Uncharacterized protein n=1 Tax=Penicillium alfredii TaxID=1506179 RepID=A0A9W9K3Z8_9EURO|nr:uncharacterized protein NUU61_006820 [Penicillium alfredii]KAJ5091950.1 hypothetical protein NUU61_006820 [Penicillium alfredii]